MRFGHCKNCWWWKEGYCYMYHNRTEETSYCPDYTNRKKENKEGGETLEDWIKRKNVVKLGE